MSESTGFLRGSVKRGAQIGDYLIKGQIAVGGFGTIWRAEHVTTGQVVAIKILHASLISSEVLVKRFEREARAIALMRHPNIVELYGHGRLPDGRPYLVMEHLEGRDLGAHIMLRGSLPAREILPILAQLSGALGAAHAQGIIHRDIKASNVFLSERQGALRVVLFDFGVAKLLSREDSDLTQSSTLVGSPACMSPEQILGHPVDARTDVYALGSLIYQMLVAHPPFSGASPTAILTMHLDDYPPFPSIHGDVSPAFDSVVMRAMSKEPDERFQTVVELVDAFRDALHGSESSDQSAPQDVSETPSHPESALGLYIGVEVAPEELEEPDDGLLDDIELIVPVATQYLTKRGYLTAYERGTAALFVRFARGDRWQDAGERRREIDGALALLDTLEHRPTKDARVCVRVYLHVDEVIVDGDTVEGGTLLDATDWTPAALQSGVFASTAVLAGLDIETQEVSALVRRILAPGYETTDQS